MGPSPKKFQLTNVPEACTCQMAINNLLSNCPNIKMGHAKWNCTNNLLYLTLIDDILAHNLNDETGSGTAHVMRSARVTLLPKCRTSHNLSFDQINLKLIQKFYKLGTVQKTGLYQTLLMTNQITLLI